MKNMKDKFRCYYELVRLSLPDDLDRREWGFMKFNNPVMYRHRQMKEEKCFRGMVRSCVPAHIFYSAARYEFPSDENMKDKHWLGADLIFDLDAENQADFGKVRSDTINLYDTLRHEFGILEKYIKINFSGRRGFHIHVDDPKIQTLGSAERREIADYITGTGKIEDRKIKFQKIQNGIKIKIDTPVTVDVHRLVRLPGSLHGGSGLVAMPLSISELLENFEPEYAKVFLED